MVRKRFQRDAESEGGNNVSRMEADAPQADDLHHDYSYEVAEQDDECYHVTFKDHNRRRNTLIPVVTRIIIAVSFPFVLLRLLRGGTSDKVASSSSAKKIILSDAPIRSIKLETYEKTLMKHESKQSPTTLATAPKQETKQNQPDSDSNQCTQYKLPPKDPKRIIEPIWLPAYPTSIPGPNGEAYSKFLEALTGIRGSAKLYYRQSKKLRRCHSHEAVGTSFVNMGVTCEIHHPIVPCENPHPSKQAENFAKPIVVAMRNPLTVFPAFFQMKAEKYHGAKGQITEVEWNKFRDEYVGDGSKSQMFDEWKKFILEWREMEPYHVALYLPYEQWKDQSKGAELAEKLSRILVKEGFPVLFESDESEKRDKSKEIECIWRENALKVLAEEEKKHADEGWYIPTYTNSQLEMLSTEFENLINDVKGKPKRPGDEQLIEILLGYKESVAKLTL
mmetsp:Transcript_2204/g.4818  ORF Transcript_2204/g.4818 Transcript_2204/m.4818 type:complete len:448 (-) Transcript_2204:30-1373(-)